MIKNITIGILSIVLILSLIINIFFLKGKGINIDKSITTHSESFSTSMSGSMIVNGTFYGGNTFERKVEYFNSEQEAELFMQKLNIFSWLWCKELYAPINLNNSVQHKFIVKYPWFFTEETKKATK